MLALIQNNAVIGTVSEYGWFTLPDGRSSSPAMDGWKLDGYGLVKIVDAEPVPSGKRITGTSVDIVNGAPKYVHVLVDLTDSEIWAPIRSERDSLLTASDWTQLPDAPIAVGMRSAWGVYRQALRDVTKQSDPSNIVWPAPPA